MGQTRYEAIVIGTSAGGLNALSTLLGKLPADYPVPVIVVQHRSKYPRDLLEEVLQSKCKIKIKQADEKEKIKPGYVYTAPPDYHLLIENDHTFSLSSDEFIYHSRPSIDVLFESAANIYANKLAGIILTGASSDGAAGILAISNHGGLTIGQDPQEAEYAIMPLASIDTKKVSYVLKLSEIQTFLLETIFTCDGKNK